MEAMARRLFLALLAALFLGVGASAPFRAESFYGLAQPYLFSLAGWEGSSLLGKARGLLGGSAGDGEVVRRYFAGEGALEARVEAILGAQVSQVLRQEGINPFPPVLAEIDQPPHLLIIAYRDRLELARTILLRPRMTLREREGLEGRVERLGYPALVEGLGGVSTYPSLVLRGSGLEATVEGMAHEWVHQYFFFRPLGRRYTRSYDLTTINETAASMVGKEIAARVLRLYGREIVEREPAPSTLDRRLRDIRLKVEALLAERQVAEAEELMRQETLALQRDGFSIRKLNQAYFAFYGSYADSPTATSPIGEELKQLRRKSPSLGDFLRQVAQVRSREQLQALAY